MAIVNNPYNDLLGIMVSQGSINNPPGLKLGTVKSIKPLSIIVDGLELNESFIHVAENLRPHSRESKLNGSFDITLSKSYTPEISTYDMPNKATGMGIDSTAKSISTVTGGDGTVKVTVATTVDSRLTGDSHNHGSHSHTTSSLSNITGNGSFNGCIEYTDWAIKAGDTVIVLSSNDKQSYVVIAKI